MRRAHAPCPTPPFRHPSPELVSANVEMKHRNPRFGHRRIAQQIVMDQYSRKIVGFAIESGTLDGPVVCRMLNQIIAAAPRVPEGSDEAMRR